MASGTIKNTTHDRSVIYAQTDKTITLSFSGNAVTRRPIAYLIVNGQSGVTNPITISFIGMGNVQQIKGVLVSNNTYGITASGSNIVIPPDIGYSWGYVYIREIELGLKDITISASYS